MPNPGALGIDQLTKAIRITDVEKKNAWTSRGERGWDELGGWD